MTLRLGAIALAFVSLSLAAAQETAIVGARVETGSGQVIDNATVVIQGDRLVSVGTGAAPSGATVVDGKGLTIYPGFVDGYLSDFLRLPEGPALGTPPDRTNTAPPTMWVGNRQGVRPEVKAAECVQWDDMVKRLQSYGITTAQLAPSGGMFRGQNAVVYASADKVVAVPVFGFDISLRGGGGGGFRNYPGSLLGIIALMRQTLADAQGFQAGTKDPAMEAMQPLMKGESPAVFSANTEIDIVRAYRLADEFKLKTVLVGVTEGYKSLEFLKERKPLIIASVDIGSVPSTEVSADGDGPPKEVLIDRANTWTERSGNLKAMIEAGLPIVFSSTGGGLSSYLENVRKVIATGVKREAALRCLTASDLLGIANSGEVAAGKIANLTILSGPFDDAKSEVRMVVVNGKVISLKKEAAL